MGKAINSTHQLGALIGHFTRGETQRLVDLPLLNFKTVGRPDLLVGALVLGGDFERALAVSREFESRDCSGAISFYLSLGFSRAGRYDESLERIKRLETMTAPGLHAFYFAQAQGFYSFHRGDSASAIERARSALAQAEASHDALQPLFRILSLDLLAHSMIRVGQNRRGVKTLRMARDSAIKAKHESFNHAISISLLKYEALFGLEPSRVISRLYRALVELKPQDSYSRSELRLELVRQLILRGQLREARRHLEDASADILGSQNRSQTASLHLRLAWMAKLEDRPADALLALQSAETSLGKTENPFVNNRELYTKISYFRLALFREMERTAEAEELERSLQNSHAASSLSGIEERMYRRRMDSSNSVGDAKVEDPFGELMDRVSRRDGDVAAELLNHGYFGLLLPMFGIHLGQTAIVVGAPAGRIVVLDDGEARLARVGLKGLLGKLLARLAQGSTTKREAIESIWGYTYEADRHDRLLAVAVTRIRKALGGKSRWLELQGDRIVLRDQLTLRFWTPLKAAHATDGFETGTAISPFNRFRRGLRIRQLQVLDELATRDGVGVQDLVERFGISRASALRDLNELVQAGLVIRAGETRATRYILGATN